MFCTVKGLITNSAESRWTKPVHKFVLTSFNKSENVKNAEIRGIEIFNRSN